MLVVDEAHRLNRFSGLYGNLGENQVKELIRSSRCAIFFADDDQIVTLKDIGRVAAIRECARELGAEVTDLQLTSQFRCNGSDSYLAWLDNTLQLRPTANEILDTEEFDFRVVDSPVELHRLVEQRNAESGRARVVAGYTIKRYFSEKKMSADGDWAHQRIELRPDSDRLDYRPIIIESAQEDEFVIVAELLAVLG